MNSDFRVEPFDPNNSGHVAFVMDSWRKGTVGTKDAPGSWPWNLMHRATVVDGFKRELERSTVVVAKAHGSEKLIGWAAVRDGAIVYAFAIYSARRYGFGRALLESLGIDFSQPVGLRYWTPAAARIVSRGGLRVYFDTRDGWSDASESAVREADRGPGARGERAGIRGGDAA